MVTFELAGHGQSGRRPLRPRAQAWHHHARGRRAKRRQLPVDVQAIGCDFLAFSGHKICGPTGIGICGAAGTARRHAAVSRRRRNDFVGGISKDRVQESAAPVRGWHADISGPIGLHAAMDYLDAIGRENIWKHDQELASYTYENWQH